MREMRLSERLARGLISREGDGYVVLTKGAVEELILLVESAEVIVELYYLETRTIKSFSPNEKIGFDQEYHRQLDEALQRLGKIADW